MPVLRAVAKIQSIQKNANMVFSSQGPVLPGVVPYCVMLMNIKPRLTTQAGTKRVSVGWRMEALKVEGHQ